MFAQSTPRVTTAAAASIAAANIIAYAGAAAHMIALEQGVQQALGSLSSSIPQIDDVRLHTNKHSQSV
jgi:hypothetical protein